MMPKGTPNGTSMRDLSQYKKGKYSLHKKGAEKKGEGNWDKLIEDKYLILTDANKVEAYRLGDDRKAEMIGTAESIVEARLLFCQGAKNWKMSYDGIPVDGNKGNALPQDAKQAKKTTVKKKGKQPQAPTATSDPVTTAPAEQLTPAKQPTSTTSTMVAVEDYHDIHSAVADNETWKKTTGSGLSFDRNGVTATKKYQKGHPSYPGNKGKKTVDHQTCLPIYVTIGFVVSVSRSSPVRWGKDHGVRDEADISPGRILQGLRKCFS